LSLLGCGDSGQSSGIASSGSKGSKLWKYRILEVTGGRGEIGEAEERLQGNLTADRFTLKSASVRAMITSKQQMNPLYLKGFFLGNRFSELEF
jgi:hypothetical protein